MTISPHPMMATLANAPPLSTRPSTGPAPGAGTIAPGIAEGGKQPVAPAPDSTFIYITLAIVVGMVFFSFMASRKERKRRDSLLSAIKRHDRVQTIGGIIGSVVEVKPDVVVLKVDESSNVRMTFARSSVQSILKEGPAEG
ncbi:MAG: preprotein translocase subunit YajC [Phycisphaerales bacterium]